MDGIFRLIDVLDSTKSNPLLASTIRRINHPYSQIQIIHKLTHTKPSRLLVVAGLKEWQIAVDH